MGPALSRRLTAPKGLDRGTPRGPRRGVSGKVYELRPESIKTFIGDQTIKLPRFQRSQTWNARKNFELSLSLFRDYPLGVVVIRTETRDKRTKPSRPSLEKYLIDGRQRLNALSRVSNPEEVYWWAKDALKLRSSQSREEVADRFWRYVDEYFGQDEDIAELTDAADTPELDPEGDNAAGGGDTAPQSEELGADLEGNPEPALGAGGTAVEGGRSATGSELSEAPGLARGPGFQGLQDLLQVILTVHPKTVTGSSLTKPFDFRRFGLNLDIIRVDPVSGKSLVDASKLIGWIQFKRGHIGKLGPYPATAEEFLPWLLADPKSDPKFAGKLQAEIVRRWAHIESVFTALTSIENRIQEAKIGYLELRDCTANDERKIFVIINSAGTPLTAAEILSAKPAWNRVVEKVDPLVDGDRHALYNEAGLQLPDNVVRWDIAATLLRRVKSRIVFGED